MLSSAVHGASRDAAARLMRLARARITARAGGGSPAGQRTPVTEQDWNQVCALSPGLCFVVPADTFLAIARNGAMCQFFRDSRYPACLPWCLRGQKQIYQKSAPILLLDKSAGQAAASRNGAVCGVISSCAMSASAT